MPTENEKTAAPAAPVPDTRDAEISTLKQKVADLEKRLASAPVAPTGDYCVLGGKTYEIAGTVICKHASEEGRRSNLDPEAELVVLKR